MGTSLGLSQKMRCGARSCFITRLALILLCFGLPVRADAPGVETELEPNVSTAPHFEVDANSLSRGSLTVPSVIHAEPTRSLRLIDIGPKYSADGGVTEWGIGWDTPQLRIDRTQPTGAPRFDSSDSLASAWGLFQLSSNGRYLTAGLRSGAEATIGGNGAVSVVDTSGTKFLFGLRVDAPGLGTVRWLLTRVEHLAGDSVELDYNTEHSYPRLDEVRWKKSGEITLVSRLRYRSMSPLPNYALGFLRSFTERVAGMDVLTVNRHSHGLETIKTYRLDPDLTDEETWLLRSVEETQFLGQLKSAHSTHYQYGDFWPSNLTAQMPAPSLVPEAAQLPTYSDGSSVLPPDHAMTSRFWVAADYENDGVTDYMFYANKWGAPPSWWIHGSNGFENRPEETNAVDRCKHFKFRPRATTATAGFGLPYLFGVEAGQDELSANVVQCLNGAVVADQTVYFSVQPLADCPSVSSLPTEEAISQFEVLDMNADGVVDLVFKDECSIYVAAGGGRGIGVAFGVSNDGLKRAIRLPVIGLHSNDRLRYTDVNGDGLTDVVVDGDSSRVWLSHSTSGGLPTFAAAPFDIARNNSDEYNAYCETTFVTLNADPFVDRIDACPAGLYFYAGHPSGFSLLRRESPATSVRFAALGGPFAPGFQLINSVADRASANEACPQGSRGSTIVTTLQSGQKVPEYKCSPLVHHVPLRSANSGRLISVYDGEAHRVDFAYRYADPGLGLGPPRVLLDSVTETVGGRDPRKYTMTYDIPDVRPDIGSFWGFKLATVKELNLRTGAAGPTVVRAFEGVGTSWVLTATESIARDGLLAVDAQKFSLSSFRNVPWVRLDATSSQRGSPTTPLMIVQQRTLTYESGTICPATIVSTSGDRAFGAPTATSVFQYAGLFTDPALNRRGDPGLACDATKKTSTSDVDSEIEVRSTSYDSQGNLLGTATGRFPDEVYDSWRKYDRDGLLIEEAVPGSPPRTFTYEQGATGGLRLLKSVSVLKRKVTYERDPVRDLRLSTQLEQRGQINHSGSVWDADGRPVAEWSDTRGGRNSPWQTTTYWRGDLLHAAGAAIESSLRPGAKRKSVVFVDGLGVPVGTGALWTDAAPVFRMTGFRNEPEDTLLTEGGFLTVPDVTAVEYGDLNASKLGDLVTRRELLGREQVTIRVAPGVEELWTTATSFQSDGIATRTSVAEKTGRYSQVKSSLISASVTTNNDGTESTVWLDSLGRIRKVSLPGGDSQLQTFDEFGRKHEITHGDIVRTFIYSPRTSRLGCVHTTDAKSGLLEERCNDWSPANVLDRISSTGNVSACDNVARNDIVFLRDDNLELTQVRGLGFVRLPTFDAEGRQKDEVLHLLKPDVYDYTGLASAFATVHKSVQFDMDGSVSSERSIVQQGGKDIYDSTNSSAPDATGWPVHLQFGGTGVDVGRERDKTVYRMGSGETISIGHRDGLRTTDSVDVRAQDGAPVCGLSKTVDTAGRVTTEAVTNGTANETATYLYKGNRLQRADFRPGTGWIQYVHTPGGLLQTREEPAGANVIARTKEKLTVGKEEWLLDVLGRVRERDGRTFCWSASNQILKVFSLGGNADGSQFGYDERGKRLWAATSKDGVLEMKGTVGSLSISPIRADTGASSVTSTLSLNGIIVGTHDGASWHPTVFDFRNSNRLAKDGEMLPLRPYGERPRAQRQSLDWPDFVGGHYEPSLGMVRLGDRDYLPDAGQFARADDLFLNSMEACARNPLGCNLYGYTRSDPVNYSDPTGFLDAETARLCAEFGGCGEPIYVERNQANESPRDSMGAGEGRSDSGPRGGSGDANRNSREQQKWRLIGNTLSAMGSVSLSIAMLAITAPVQGAVYLGLVEDTAEIVEASEAAEALEAGEGAEPATAEEGFFEGTHYTKKVVEQMKGGPGEFHSFPESVTAWESAGTVRTIKGGDGVARQMLEIPGSYRGRDGVFQFIRESDGAINHRLFIPGGP